MKRDAAEDPKTNPNALHARHLIGQVSFNLLVSKYYFLYLEFLLVGYLKIELEGLLDLC